MTPQSYRILAVDDVADNLLLLKTILELEGYSVDTADSGTSALHQLRVSPPDLVLLDIMMPDMSGYEVTRHIRKDKELGSIPILLVTAYADVSASQRLELGANGFIRKPIDADELLDKVRQTLKLDQTVDISERIGKVTSLKSESKA
jgi:CheY-like chemotaxis protein